MQLQLEQKKLFQLELDALNALLDALVTFSKETKCVEATQFTPDSLQAIWRGPAYGHRINFNPSNHIKGSDDYMDITKAED